MFLSWGGRGVEVINLHVHECIDLRSCYCFNQVYQIQPQWSGRYPVKTSQVICWNVLFLVSIFSLYLMKLDIANIFCEHTGRNVPKSNRPKSKHPKVNMSQVKTSQVKTSQSQNVPESKCPRIKTSQVKMSQVKTSQSQNVRSQIVPSCLSGCKHYSGSYEVLSTHIKHAILFR